MPKARNNEIKEEPPLLINGKGIPTTGSKPTTIHKFIIKLAAKVRLSPPITNLQNLSLALNAKYRHLNNINKYMLSNNSTPRNPNSSPITEKIKSVSVSGRKFKCVCDPSPKPFPNNPPEPIATLDWMIFQLAPNGSDSGLKKVAILWRWKGCKIIFHINGELTTNNTNDPPIKVQLKPERKRTNNPEKAIISAVPRSGCLKTNKKQQTITSKLIPISFFCIGSFLSNKKLAKKIGTASFKNSED